MDVQMPEMNGVNATRRICTQDAQAKVIILTTFDDGEYVFEGIRAGALGYLLKATSGSEWPMLCAQYTKAVRSSNRRWPAK